MAIEKIMRNKGTVYRALIRRHRVRVSKCFTRRIDAERWEREQWSSSESTTVSTNDIQMSLNQLRERFDLEYARMRQVASTAKLELGIYTKHIAPLLGDAMISQITAQDIESFMWKLMRNSDVSVGRINRVRGLLHGMFNCAIRWKLLRLNPVSEVRPLPTDTRPLERTYNFLSQDEAKRLLDWTAANDSWVYPKVRVLLNCGLRFGEMSALRVRDFVPTPRGGILRVSRTACRHTLEIRARTKGRSSRVIPLSRSMASYLKTIAGERSGDEPLLWMNWEEIRNPWKFGKRFRLALTKVRITPIRVHDLRHTFAVHFLERGGHLYDLQNLLGHSTSKLTERYSHFSNAMLERACGIVDHHGTGKPTLSVIDGGERSEMSHKSPTKQSEDEVPVNQIIH